MRQGRLYYVMGPWGAGKDSVIEWARVNGPSYDVAYAHRYVTPSLESLGGNHVALTPVEFDLRERRGLFALTWQAHGLRCGLGKEIEHWLRQGVDVLVNGSRGAFPSAQARFNDMVPVLITASRESIVSRMLSSGPEAAEQIDQRLARHDSYVVPEKTVTIVNEGNLPEAGMSLLKAIRNHSA
ncbi:phosphonate metabolism protein/1,5-bisphosphokinase (PRPP-forming) PhnN [Dyella solisilvae]|uniref:ribose 1,5-bisphosphate phosphokinase n=1 Tax=Dyella solisilvae TaxID=1920168 RepID=A0A370K4W1_9GAMM|nr:phosphonate metabolism protein/1,5-bisphosphokinase (PRPP-forming) PhnN [Dyella solisilvae]RDI97683.1 phosphonate metabolism protein/1,5-bisphosphokinase (PRPP-forming) PhnN [Dyella solisilvae]